MSLSPCGYSESWPALRNQRPDDRVPHLRQLMERRIAAAKWWRRTAQWSYCWLWHRPLRGSRRAFAWLIHPFATSPAKTTTDILTGIPIALLAWPPYRQWTVDHATISIVLGAVILFRVVFSAYQRNNSRKARRQAIWHTQTLALAPMEMVLRHGLDAQRGYMLGPQLFPVAVRALLDSVILLTRHGLQIPRGVTVHANLMLAMEVVAEDGTQVPGLGIVEYNTQGPAAPSWTKVIKGDFIAGTVLETGKVQVLEDTQDPAWWGIYHGVRSRSFATFPITAPDRSIVGVVNVDADRPMIFRRGDVVQQLWPVLAPTLVLVANLLEAGR